MIYRSFIIEDSGYLVNQLPLYTWRHEDFDGPEDPRHGLSTTLESAKTDIDEFIEENN